MVMKSDKPMLTVTGRTLRRVLRNSRGATAIEYGLILAFVVIALIVGLTNLADSTIGMWGKVDTKVANAR